MQKNGLNRQKYAEICKELCINMHQIISCMLLVCKICKKYAEIYAKGSKIMNSMQKYAKKYAKRYAKYAENHNLHGRKGARSLHPSRCRQIGDEGGKGHGRDPPASGPGVQVRGSTVTVTATGRHDPSLTRSRSRASSESDSGAPRACSQALDLAAGSAQS